MKRYVQVYTGNGKGKTTASFGLALRAAGAGLNTFIAQFAKGMHSSELTALERFSDRITIRQYGRDRFISGLPRDIDTHLARNAFLDVQRITLSGRYDIVILDEINVAVYFNLIPVDHVLNLIATRPDTVELVCTGRYADQRIIACADLVTEMKEIKHYYTRGVAARTGIEH
jgi:cob(I)alamin adenosyltransferase